MSIEAQQETLSFQAEVSQLMHLVANALYSNKEIFLRELISNSSDAADKLRFEALSDNAMYENDSDLKIWVDADDKARTVTVRDNGIGMSREEVVENLGTIARSGTKEFIEKLAAKDAKDSNLIGQFGVGFYSAFVVADKVTVNTRRAGAKPDQGVCWESDGKGQFTIKNIEKAGHGTEIILYLKDGEDEFLDPMRLRAIITKYSDHILLPVIMKKIPATLEEGDKKSESEEEVVNRAKALWTMPRTQIKDDDYKALYKHIAHDFEEPLVWSHNKVEGKQDYISLLYLPSHAPFDLWNRDHPRGLKLYVQRVFIMDDAEQLMPMYLRFIKGVVDSSDLPLNVSREILQSNKTIEAIKSGCVKRVLSMLDKLSKDEEKYKIFWKEFGAVLKEGPAEDFANRDRIAKLLRFSTTSSDESAVSLQDYVLRMKEGQDKIYYVVADSLSGAKNSPHLEVFKKQGIEVLLMHDRVDEWLMAHLTEFDGKQLQSVSKGGLDLGDLAEEKPEEQKQKDEVAFVSVIKQMKEALGDRVKEVRLTDRLTDSPACLVADDNEMSMHLQRMMQEAGQLFPGSKPILELNPDHPILQRLRNEQDDDCFKEWSQLLFDQAFLAEGGKLEDPASFVKRLNKFLV